MPSQPKNTSLKFEAPLASVVITGADFKPSMIDHEDLFDGDLDGDSILAFGPIVSYTYRKNMFSFTLTPDRIDIRAHASEQSMPADLVQSAHLVAKGIDKVREHVNVAAMGFNYDGSISISHQSDCQSSDTICREMFKGEVISMISGIEQELVRANATFTWMKDQLQFTVQCEPDNRASENGMFLATNAQKVIEKHDSLQAALQNFNSFVSEIEAIRARISRK